MKRAQALGLFAVAWLGLGASCGETNMEAISRLRPRGTEMRHRLQSVARALPPPGSVESASGPATPFVPPLVLDYREHDSTADVLMEPQLLDPDRDLSRELDLMLSPELLSCLMWTGPHNPLDASVWDDRTELGRDCERALSIKWLVVVRTSRYDLPESVELEVFVVDVPRFAVAAQFPIALRGRYAKTDLGRGPWAGEALDQLRSDAFVVARCELVRRLDALPGTRIDLDEAWGSLMSAQRPCARPPKTFVVSALRSEQSP